MERYEVILRIRYDQHEGEALLDQGEAWAEGQLARTGDGWLLRYKEAEAEAEMLLLDGQVQMRRFAEGSRQVLSEGSYREQVEATMRYEAEGYSLSLAVYPQRVLWCVEPPFADVCLEYLLKIADAQGLRHRIRIQTEGCEGGALKARARTLLGDCGFVRWADDEDALLVTDAGRAAKRRGIDEAPIRKGLEQRGWHVNETEGLWWLDPPEEAYHRALRARSMPGDQPWQNGALGELQAMCNVMLQGGPPKEAPLTEQARATIRKAWKSFYGSPEQVFRSVRTLTRRFAQARRRGVFAAEYACGVLLARYLRRLGSMP